MGGIIKLLVGLLLLGVLAVGAFGLYVAVVAGALDIPGLTSLRTEGQGPSPETVARSQQVERKVEEAVQDKSAFLLTLTDEELSALLAGQLDASSPVRDAQVNVRPDEIGFTGNLNGRVPVPFSGVVGVGLTGGDIDLTLKDVSVGFIPLPGGAKQELEPLLEQVLNVGESLQEAGAVAIQQLKLETGMLTIVGIQQGGQLVSDSAKEFILNAASQGGPGGPPPAPPGPDVVPVGSAGTTEAGDELYLALGDSLAANVGVTDPREGYVSRFHAYMERETGRSLGLLNLGVSGESTLSIVRTQLPRALQELRSRRSDGDPDTKVSALTLDLGANDFLGHLASQECQDAPRGPACSARIDAALETYRVNFAEIVAQLKAEIEPDTEFYIMTVYNPFDFGVGLPFEDFSNEVLDRVNDVVRETASANGAKLAEADVLMQGNAGGWTLMITEGDIHPNTLGYQALAYSLAQAREEG
jgi:lysophospholipase L1-like esterase